MSSPSAIPGRIPVHGRVLLPWRVLRVYTGRGTQLQVLSMGGSVNITEALYYALQQTGAQLLLGL